MASFFDVIFSNHVVEHKFYDIDLPFEIEPNQFINWLITIGEEVFENEYGMSVCGMCEYACLWICKKASDAGVNPERLHVCYGDYGFGKHYWIMLDNDYFIDLTLAQFKNEAPELAITRKIEAIGVTAYSEDFSKETYTEYLNKFL